MCEYEHPPGYTSPPNVKKKHILIGIFGVCLSHGTQYGVQESENTRTKQNAGNTK